jgi:hypothetical protein
MSKNRIDAAIAEYLQVAEVRMPLRQRSFICDDSVSRFRGRRCPDIPQ